MRAPTIGITVMLSSWFEEYIYAPPRELFCRSDNVRYDAVYLTDDDGHVYNIRSCDATFLFIIIRTLLQTRIIKQLLCYIIIIYVTTIL